MRLNPDIQHSRDKARPIFEELRRQILAGRFKQGEKLPGSRAMASEIGVARGTVNMALAMLAAEGLVSIHPASGIRVAVAVENNKAPASAAKVRFSRWAQRLPANLPRSETPFFATGRLADEFFPERAWLHAVKAGRRTYGILSSDTEQTAAGFLPLRKMIAAHLSFSRGLTARAENIAIVNGSMQAITLITQLLLDHKDAAAFENPGFHGIRSAIRATGAEALAQDVDSEGMVTPRRKSKLVVVTPASQFPTGITMSHARRVELLDYARRHNAFIVEDEYDSEFSRLANAPQPLKLIDRDERVIYVGSFSRTMFASLRLGYCLLPDALMDAFLRARQLYDSVPPAFADQVAMAAFMQAGHYRRHIKRMNKIYRERHDLLLGGLTAQLGDRFDFSPSAAGLSLYARWKKSPKEFAFLKEGFISAGIAWQDVSRYFAGEVQAAALFGFSHLDAVKIAAALRKMRAIRG